MIRPYLLLLLCLLTACNSRPESTPTPNTPPSPTPDPATLLRLAGEQMQTLESVHFVIAREGGTAFLDPEQTLNLVSAEGDYAAPNASQAILALQSSGVNLQINTIAIGDEQWITNPLTQAWEQLPLDWGFNPAILFDPQVGWQRLLSEDISGVQLLEQVEIGGQRRYRLQAEIAGERLAIVTGGAAESDRPVTTEIWLDPTNLYVTALNFTLPTPAGDAHWQITFTQFNAPLTIQPPN